MEKWNSVTGNTSKPAQAVEGGHVGELRRPPYRGGLGHHAAMLAVGPDGVGNHPEQRRTAATVGAWTGHRRSPMPLRPGPPPVGAATDAPVWQLVAWWAGCPSPRPWSTTACGPRRTWPSCPSSPRTPGREPVHRGPRRRLPADQRLADRRWPRCWGRPTPTRSPGSHLVVLVLGWAAVTALAAPEPRVRRGPEPHRGPRRGTPRDRVHAVAGPARPPHRAVRHGHGAGAAPMGGRWRSGSSPGSPIPSRPCSWPVSPASPGRPSPGRAPTGTTRGRRTAPPHRCGVPRWRWPLPRVAWPWAGR